MKVHLSTSDSPKCHESQVNNSQNYVFEVSSDEEVDNTLSSNYNSNNRRKTNLVKNSITKTEHPPSQRNSAVVQRSESKLATTITSSKKSESAATPHEYVIRKNMLQKNRIMKPLATNVHNCDDAEFPKSLSSEPALVHSGSTEEERRKLLEQQQQQRLIAENKGTHTTDSTNYDQQNTTDADFDSKYVTDQQHPIEYTKSELDAKIDSNSLRKNGATDNNDDEISKEKPQLKDSKNSVEKDKDDTDFQQNDPDRSHQNDESDEVTAKNKLEKDDNNLEKPKDDFVNKEDNAEESQKPEYSMANEADVQDHEKIQDLQKIDSAMDNADVKMELNEKLKENEGIKENDNEGVKADEQEGIKADENEGVKADEQEGIKADENEGVKADEQEGIKADENEGVKANDNEGVKADEQEGIKADENEGVKADEQEGIKANDNEGIKADENEGINADEDEGVKADENEGVKADEQEGINAYEREGTKAQQMEISDTEAVDDSEYKSQEVDNNTSLDQMYESNTSEISSNKQLIDNNTDDAAASVNKEINGVSDEIDSADVSDVKTEENLVQEESVDEDYSLPLGKTKQDLTAESKTTETKQLKNLVPINQLTQQQTSDDESEDDSSSLNKDNSPTKETTGGRRTLQKNKSIYEYDDDAVGNLLQKAISHYCSSRSDLTMRRQFLGYTASDQAGGLDQTDGDGARSDPVTHHIAKDGLIIGKLDVFNTVITTEYLLPFKDTSFAAFIDQAGVMRSIASKTKCQIELTRRVLNKSMGSRWVKYIICNIKGPSGKSVSTCDHLLRQKIPIFNQRKQYDNEARCSLFMQERLVDNTSLYFNYQRTGPTSNQLGALPVTPPMASGKSRNCPWRVGMQMASKFYVHPKASNTLNEHVYVNYGSQLSTEIPHVSVDCVQEQLDKLMTNATKNRNKQREANKRNAIPIYR